MAIENDLIKGEDPEVERIYTDYKPSKITAEQRRAAKEALEELKIKIISS